MTTVLTFLLLPASLLLQVFILLQVSLPWLFPNIVVVSSVFGVPTVNCGLSHKVFPDVAGFLLLLHGNPVVAGFSTFISISVAPGITTFTSISVVAGITTIAGILVFLGSLTFLASLLLLAFLLLLESLLL
jgi:hypothetical protein